MSRLAQIDEISSPTVGPLGRLPERHPGIIAARDHDCRKRQRIARQVANGFEFFRIRRRNEQCRRNPVRFPRRGVNRCKNSKAMGDDDVAAGIAMDVTANPRRPDRKVGFIPITLNDPDGSRNLLLEPGLPMARAARAEAWNNEGSGHGVSHEFGLQSALRDTFD